MAPQQGAVVEVVHVKWTVVGGTYEVVAVDDNERCELCTKVLRSNAYKVPGDSEGGGNVLGRYTVTGDWSECGVVGGVEWEVGM